MTWLLIWVGLSFALGAVWVAALEAKYARRRRMYQRKRRARGGWLP